MNFGKEEFWGISLVELHRGKGKSGFLFSVDIVSEEVVNISEFGIGIECEAFRGFFLVDG